MVPFSVDPLELNKNVTIGTSENFTISIKNTGINWWIWNSTQELDYKINGLNETWINADGLKTSLSDHEIKFIQIEINVRDGTIPGKYNGEILLSSDRWPMSLLNSKWKQRIKTSLIIDKPKESKDVKINVHQNW